MIKSLTLRNFQSHKDTHLDFTPGVNVIVGPSDSGKTAVVRALRWLAWNRPLGDAFISSWGGPASVELHIDDSSIHRTRGTTDQYRLDKTEFTAFATNVPDEIQQALNINEINLQQQLDSPFLLTESPGEVAKHFNRIAHLDEIDNGIKNIQKWIREIEGRVKYTGEQITQQEEKLKQYDYLDQFEVDVETLEDMQQRMVSTINQRRMLTALVDAVNTLTQEIEESAVVTRCEAEVDTILSLYEKTREIEGKQANLQDFIMSLSLLNEELKDVSAIMEEEGLIDNLLTWTKLRNTLMDQHEKITRNTAAIVTTETNQKRWEKKAKELHEKFDREFPDVCPLCNQKIVKK